MTTSPGYVPAAWYCHQLDVTVFRSGSVAVPRSRTVSPGRPVSANAPLILTTGSWLASLKAGVTDHLSRAAKSFCAAAKNLALTRVVGFGACAPRPPPAAPPGAAPAGAAPACRPPAPPAPAPAP